MGYMGSKSRGYGPPPPGGPFMGGGGGGNGGTGGGSPPRILPTQVEGPVYSQGGLGPTGGGDPKGWGREDLLPTQVENIPTGGGSPNAQSGAAFSSMLGPPPTQATPTGGGFEPPTQAPQVQTGGGSPLPDNPLAGNAMQQQMANIGGFRAPQTQLPGMPTQAPQFETGGGSPNENMIPPHMLAQALNMPDGPPTGLTPNSGMMQMNRIPAGSAPAAYGGGGTNWQDRPIGPMRQGPGIPAGWTADPNASGNPFWQPILNSRGSWWNERG